MEYLVTMTTHVPAGTSEAAVQEIRAREAAQSSELEEVLASMPLRVWRTDEVTPLSPHPSDPALTTT